MEARPCRWLLSHCYSWLQSAQVLQQFDELEWAAFGRVGSGDVAQQASQAVNGGVCEACTGALEPSTPLWAKAQSVSQGGTCSTLSLPLPTPPHEAGLCCYCALSPNWRGLGLKGEASMQALEGLRPEHQPRCLFILGQVLENSALVWSLSSFLG